MWSTMNSWMPSRKIWRKRNLLQHREERTHGPCCGVTAASHRPTNTESTGQTHTVTGPPLRVTARSEDQFRWDVKEEIRPLSSYAFPFSACQKCLAMSIHTPTSNKTGCYETPLVQRCPESKVICEVMGTIQKKEVKGNGGSCTYLIMS